MIFNDICIYIYIWMSIFRCGRSISSVFLTTFGICFTFLLYITTGALLLFSFESGQDQPISHHSQVRIVLKTPLFTDSNLFFGLMNNDIYNFQHTQYEELPESFSLEISEFLKIILALDIHLTIFMITTIFL